jgi:NTE family protein
MLFHVGSLRRLNEFGLLSAASRFSSVSGGSIASAVLATRWSRLKWNAEGVATNFGVVEQPIYDLAGKTIDIRSGLASVVPFRSAAQALARSYSRLLFGAASLQDLPDKPRFTFNTTNFATGSLFRWSKEYGADYQLGTIFSPEVPIADVVAASSAFPPFLSPMNIPVPGTLVDHSTMEPISNPTHQLTLTDGGVYDNLGLQAAESFHTVLASDGGAPLDYSPKLRSNWLSQSMRTAHLIDAQVRALRRRHLVREFERGERLGALWTITTPMGRYPAGNKTSVSDESVRRLASVSTRLASMPQAKRRRLINWGYLSADAAIRSYVEPSLPEWVGIPYPEEALSQ